MYDNYVHLLIGKESSFSKTEFYQAGDIWRNDVTMFHDGLTWLFDVSLLVLLLTPELLPLAACFDLLGLLSLGTGIFHVDDSFKKPNHTSLNIHFLL